MVLPAPVALFLERVLSRSVAPAHIIVDQTPSGEAALERDGRQISLFSEGADEAVLELERFAGAVRGFARLQTG